MFRLLIYICLISTGLASEVTPLTTSENSLSIETNLAYESDPATSLIIYRGFVVKYNYLKRIPYFTIHLVSEVEISSKDGVIAKRRSTFFVDDNNLGPKSATNRDYVRSGYDKGHMVPAGDFVWDQLKKNETFVLTNISPQNPVLNRGIWASMENSIRSHIIKNGHNAYIITGTIYDRKNEKSIGPGEVGVPNYFYKIVYIPDEDKMYAFLFDNDVSSYQGSLAEHQVRVDDIEKIVREDFYDKLPDEIENRLESSLIPFE